MLHREGRFGIGKDPGGPPSPVALWGICHPLPLIICSSFNSFLVPPDFRLSSYLKYPHPCFFALSEVICAGISSQRTLISAPKIRMLGNRGTVVPAPAGREPFTREERDREAPKAGLLVRAGSALELAS